jgi:hypothetical protein
MEKLPTMGINLAFELGNSELTRCHVILLLHIEMICVLSFLLVFQSKILYDIYNH